MVRLERLKPQESEMSEMPSLGKSGKRIGGVGWGLCATEDRQDEQTDRNRRTSISVSRFLAIKYMRSLGS
ncbi:hypothetical protein U1Q18_021910 [Sarracenia purpurea var. burkii]